MGETGDAWSSQGFHTREEILEPVSDGPGRDTFMEMVDLNIQIVVVI
jgi:hypothetical protein